MPPPTKAPENKVLPDADVPNIPGFQSNPLIVESYRRQARLRREQEERKAERAAAQKRLEDAQNVIKKQRQDTLDAVDPKIGARIAEVARVQFVATQGVHASPWTKYNDDGTQNNKCNIFVFSVLGQAGAPAPLVTKMATLPNGETLHRKEPIQPLAEHWGNPSYTIGHWQVVDNPRPGDVASNGEHVGIVVDGHRTISQSSKTNLVEDTDWGFRKDNGGAMVFRRYVP